MARPRMIFTVILALLILAEIGVSQDYEEDEISEDYPDESGEERTAFLDAFLPHSGVILPLSDAWKNQHDVDNCSKNRVFGDTFASF